MELVILGFSGFLFSYLLLDMRKSNRELKKLEVNLLELYKYLNSYAYINEGKLSIVIIGTMNPNKNIYINIDDKGLVDMIRDKDNKISNIIYNVNESQNTEIKLR